MKYSELNALVTKDLIEWLPLQIKRSIDTFVSLGQSREQIWRAYQDAMRRQGVAVWQPTYLAIHAYLWPDRIEVPGYRDTVPERSDQ